MEIIVDEGCTWCSFLHSDKIIKRSPWVLGVFFGLLLERQQSLC